MRSSPLAGARGGGYPQLHQKRRDVEEFLRREFHLVDDDFSPRSDVSEGVTEAPPSYFRHPSPHKPRDAHSAEREARGPPPFDQDWSRHRADVGLGKARSFAEQQMRRMKRQQMRRCCPEDGSRRCHPAADGRAFSEPKPCFLFEDGGAQGDEANSEKEERRRRRNVLLFRAQMMQDTARRSRRDSAPPKFADGTPGSPSAASPGSPHLQFTALIPSGEGLPQEEAVRRAWAAAKKQMRSLQGLPTREERQRGFKDLLRAWHPDKNLQNSELATIVFQRLHASKASL